MRAPNFFILGVQKAGVPFLKSSLSAHPDIFLSTAVRHNLFIPEHVTKQDVQTYLQANFHDHANSDLQRGVWAGEGATTYLQWPHALTNMHVHLGKKPRFVVSLRQPTEKAVAFFLHNWRQQRYAPGTTITRACDMKFGLSPRATSLYADAIQRWLDVYPADCFCFITENQLRTETQATLGKITDFVGLAPLNGATQPYPDDTPGLAWDGDTLVARGQQDGDTIYPKINKRELTALQDGFAQDIERTATLTGMDLSAWHTQPAITHHKIKKRKGPAPKPRFIFHVGFPKCGSTSIFTSFRANLPAMNDQKVFVLNDNFDIATKPSEVQNPLWQIQNAQTSGDVRNTMIDRLRQHIQQASSDTTLILSAENLGEMGGEGHFDGFDDIADVDVVGYFRPQISWIPSAWKQWQSRDGISLTDATDAFVAGHKPDYLGAINRWQAALPKARMHLRPFIREELENGHPLYDFMTLIGFTYDTLEIKSEIKNPSIDYALLHLMMLNHDLFFKSRHDSTLMHALVRRLPARYLKTNAPMLTTQMQDTITNAFRADNMEILSRMMPQADVEGYFNTYFVPRDIPEGTAYPDFPDEEIIARASDILEKTFGIRTPKPGRTGRSLAEALQKILTNP